MTEQHVIIPIIPRWQKFAFAFLAVCSVFLTLYLVSISRHGFAQESTQLVAIQRANCRAAVNANLEEIILRRDSLATRFQLEVGHALFNAQAGIHPTDADRATAEATFSALGVAEKAVDRLPKADDAADKGYTLDGRKYPPCPRVH